MNPNEINENSLYYLNTNAMRDDPYGMNPYGFSNNPYDQQPMMSDNPYTNPYEESMNQNSNNNMNNNNINNNNNNMNNNINNIINNQMNNQMEMKTNSPLPDMLFEQQIPMRSLSATSYDKQSIQSLQNNQNQNNQQNEDESLPYYCESNQLHGLTHPLELLSIRKPGIDRRELLYDENGKISLYTNVILLNDLTMNVDERKIAQLFSRICSYRKIFISNQKKYAFITLYTRKDALNVMKHLMRLPTMQRMEFGYSAMWGRDVWMKKDDHFDNKQGILTTSVETLSTNIMVNFDKTYVHFEDVMMIYGIEPKPIEQFIPHIMNNEYNHQNTQNGQPMTRSVQSDYHHFHDQQMGYQNMMYPSQTSPQRDNHMPYPNHQSPQRDQNGYRPMNRNQRPR